RVIYHPGTRTPATSPLSLHDALPISPERQCERGISQGGIVARTIVVTVAASGIGEATAALLERQGDTVIRVDLEQGDVTGDLGEDRKSTRLNSSHVSISYAVFCLKKK